MKLTEKAKVEKIILNIQSGKFNENDVDNLFIKLRPYSFGLLIFREIADFVAHNDERNRGLVNQSLKTMYLRMKFFREYNQENKEIDLGLPNPEWIRELFLLQVEKIDEGTLKKNTNYNKSELKKEINKAKKIESSFFKYERLDLKILNALNYIISFINANSICNQFQLIEEIVKVIEKNKLEYIRDDFLQQSDKIMLSILLLLHNSNFNIKGEELAFCKIGSQKDSISYNTTFINSKGEIVKHEEEYGNLEIQGHVKLMFNEKELGISHTIIETNLNIEKWCEKEMFKIEPYSADSTVKLLCKRIKFNDGITISENFKLQNIE